MRGSQTGTSYGTITWQSGAESDAVFAEPTVDGEASVELGYTDFGPLEGADAIREFAVTGPILGLTMCIAGMGSVSQATGTGWIQFLDI